MALRLQRSKKKKKSAPVTSTSTHRLEVVHGTLRSDLDGPTELPAEFLSLLSAIGGQRVLYERGDLTRAQFGQIIANMMVTTADGTEWTMGATSGLWYRRTPGGQWEVGTPPAPQFYQSVDEDLLDRYFAGGSQLEASLEADRIEQASPVEEPMTAETPDEPATAEPTVEQHPGAADIAGATIAPADAPAPYPVVSSGASAAELPTFVPTEAVDESGVWSSEWESSEKETGYAASQLDELDELEQLGLFGTVVDPFEDDDDTPPEADDQSGYGGLTD